MGQWHVHSNLLLSFFMSFLIQKPVLIAVRFMSITRNSVSVCINIAMCHSHFTLLSLIHPGVVCSVYHPWLSTLHVQRQFRSHFLTSLFLLFSYSFSLEFYFPSSVSCSWTTFIYDIPVFRLCQIGLFVVSSLVELLKGKHWNHWVIKLISAFWDLFSISSTLLLDIPISTANLLHY